MRGTVLTLSRLPTTPSLANRPSGHAVSLTSAHVSTLVPATRAMAAMMQGIPQNYPHGAGMHPQGMPHMGAGPQPGQPGMAQMPMQMQMQVSGPGGPAAQPGPMNMTPGMPPGMGPHPNAMQHMQQHQGQMFGQPQPHQMPMNMNMMTPQQLAQHQQQQQRLRQQHILQHQQQLLAAQQSAHHQQNGMGMGFAPNMGGGMPQQMGMGRPMPPFPAQVQLPEHMRQQMAQVHQHPQQPTSTPQMMGMTQQNALAQQHAAQVHAQHREQQQQQQQQQHQHQQQQQQQNVRSDAQWYQQQYEGAPCSNYLCPGTLSCVAVPHHCPCAWDKVEDKVELGEGIAVCASKGGYREGETLRKIELARKGLL